MELGKKIVSLRKMKNITQVQLAEYLSVQPQTVSRWEADGGTPDVMLLPKIAMFFGISIDELFGVTNMEQIDNLVYKYSVLRDEQSFEDAMRCIELALNSIKEDLENAKQEEIEELNQKRMQLQAWKVHIYIQKSRGALEKAEAELDELQKDVTPENPLHLSLKLQKQQFRILMGEAASVIKNVKADWEEQRGIETLYCYMAALFDAQRSAEILQLWENEDVQTFVRQVNEENEGLWLMMFTSAVMEQDLEFFERYFEMFKTDASECGIFDAKWQLLKLYKNLGLENEKEQLKVALKEKIECLNFNAYIKERYLSQISEAD